MNRSGISIGSRTPFVKRPVLIEGISRAGKFLIGNLLQGLRDIEPTQNPVFTEQIPNLIRLGFMNRAVGEQMIRSEIDSHCYEMVIGRFFNARVFDKSYIGLVPDYKKLLLRSKEEDRDKLVREFKKQRRMPCFILHESTINIALYIHLYPDARIIHIERNPIDLVFSWYQRHLVKRWTADATVFQILFQKRGHIVPWFALDKMPEYLHLPEIDKAITSISPLQMIEQKTLRALSPVQKKRIAVFHFDDVVTRPLPTIARLSSFLGKPMSGNVRAIIEREHLPVTHPDSTRKEKYKFLSDRVLKKSMVLLDDARAAYEARI